MVHVVVCGSGNGAHVITGLASSRPGMEVTVLIMKGNKAQQWADIMSGGNMTLTVKSPGTQDQYVIESAPSRITNDPEDARNCDLVILCVPAFAHAEYLIALKPFMKPGVMLIGLPGQAGFEFEVRSYWGNLIDQATILSYETLPWIAKMVEFGKSAVLVGAKKSMRGSVMKDKPNGSSKANGLLQQILGEYPKVHVTGHILGTTLNSLNGYLHPVIMYGKWFNWDGKPCERKPEFYWEVDRPTGDLLRRAGNEMVAIAKGIMSQRPGVDLSHVESYYDLTTTHYSHTIKDQTDTFTAVSTNLTHLHLTHPMIETSDGKFIPDFNHRFLSEDIPYGLVALRGIAEIAGVATPTLDTILIWGQSKINKEYLVDGKMLGSDIGDSRCPQRYGLYTLDDIIGVWGLHDVKYYPIHHSCLYWYLSVDWTRGLLITPSLILHFCKFTYIFSDVIWPWILHILTLPYGFWKFVVKEGKSKTHPSLP